MEQLQRIVMIFVAAAILFYFYYIDKRLTGSVIIATLAYNCNTAVYSCGKGHCCHPHCRFPPLPPSSTSSLLLLFDIIAGVAKTASTVVFTDPILRKILTARSIRAFPRRPGT